MAPQNMADVHETLMNKAIALAEKCEPVADRIPKVGAVIAIGDVVIGHGHRGTGTKGDDDHAEMVAISKVFDKSQLHAATLYTTLEPCTKEVRSDPTKCCTELIKQYGIRQVFGIGSPPPVRPQPSLPILFHDEPGFTNPVINMAIIRRGMKSFRDNSISARVLICVRQPLSAVSSDGTRWRSRAVAPLYGIAAAHPFAVLAFAEVGQIFGTGDPHGAGSVARHYRKLSSFCEGR